MFDQFMMFMAAMTIVALWLAGAIFVLFGFATLVRLMLSVWK